MISDIYLNIGSNSGDSRAFIARAVAALRSAFPECPLRTSGEVLSEPWGFVSVNMFINIGVVISVTRESDWTADDLEALLATIPKSGKTISAMPHRAPDGSYSDRELDIDIIAVDEIEYSSNTLTIPHPHMAERHFVLQPMTELAPHWRHPRTGLTCAQMQ